MNEKPCRCWSGLPAKKCCKGAGGNWRPRHIEAKFGGGQTGHQHPDCYASSDENCEPKLTGEHVVPEKLLDLMNFDGGLMVGNIHTGGESRSLPPTSQKAKVLCKRHNSSTSLLDDQHTLFASAVFKFSYPFYQGPKVLLVNGHNIERALLKTLTNKVFGGWTSVEGEVVGVAEWKPPQLWLDYIWGRTFELPDGWGLYAADHHVVNSIYPEVGRHNLDPHIMNRGYNIVPLFRNGVERSCTGAVISIGKLPFMLLMEDPNLDRIRTKGAVFRPRRLLFKCSGHAPNGPVTHGGGMIQLFWNKGAGGGEDAKFPTIDLETLDVDSFIARYGKDGFGNTTLK